MLCISRRPGETASHYLPIIHLTKQSVSRLIRDLLNLGLVEEQAGMRDRRERCLLLTAKGVELERQLTEAQARPRRRAACASAGSCPPCSIRRTDTT